MSKNEVLLIDEKAGRNLIPAIEKSINKDIVDKIKGSLDFSNYQNITKFGNEVNSEVEEFVNTIIDKVKISDPAGAEVNENFNSLINVIDQYDISKNVRGGLLSKLPLVGTFFQKDLKIYLQKFDTVKDRVDGLVEMLRDNGEDLITEMGVLDTLYNKHVDVVNNINNYIYAGFQTIEEMERELEVMKENNTSNDVFVNQQITDLDKKIFMMERRVNTLSSRRIMAIQTAYQIRIMQDLTTKIIDDINEVSIDVISLWKNQFAISQNILMMKQVNEINSGIREIANKQYLDNVNGLKELTGLVHKNQNAGTISIENLKRGNDLTVNIISEIRDSYNQSRQKMKADIIAIEKMEEDIKNISKGE